MQSCTAARLDLDEFTLPVVVLLVASVTLVTGTMAGMVCGGTLLGVVVVGVKAVGSDIPSSSGRGRIMGNFRLVRGDSAVTSDLVRL